MNQTVLKANSQTVLNYAAAKKTNLLITCNLYNMF